MQPKQMLATGLIVVLSGLFVLPAAGQEPHSMFQHRDPRITNPYADVIALRPGDLLYVLINERSDVENKDERRMNKIGNAAASASFDYGLSGGIGQAAGGASFDEQSATNRRFDGNAEFGSERRFDDRFTVTVTDVMPNGNLMIHGTRRVRIEGDAKLLSLTGVVRQFDVSSRNTVASQNIASLRIWYESDGNAGSETHFINQGWLARKLNRWWPN